MNNMASIRLLKLETIKQMNIKRTIKYIVHVCTPVSDQ